MALPRTVTLKDVAERAHVSQSVVSTVLNDRQNGIFVSDSTRRNVLAAASDLGYVARHRALPPVRRPEALGPRIGEPQPLERHLVGLLLGRRFAGTLFTDIFYGVNAVLSAQGYHPLVLDTCAETYLKSAKKEAEGIQYACDHGFAGIVLWHEGGTANVRLIQQTRAVMPVVAIDRRVPGVELDFVGTDHFAGAYQATRHLIALGHTRIAHLTRLETTEAAVERLRGYQQALREAGLELNPRHILLALEGGRRLEPAVVRDVFTAPDAPTAVFLLADYWAPSLYAELRELGLRVPDDVALVGFDDVVQPGLEDLELSTMAQDFDGIGRIAGQMVLRRLADPVAPLLTRVFPARLIVRRSTVAGGLIPPWAQDAASPLRAEIHDPAPLGPLPAGRSGGKTKARTRNTTAAAVV